jgi:ribose/xylose/arabinose/galactoside ABC-type transport system permease subunit
VGRKGGEEVNTPPEVAVSGRRPRIRAAVRSLLLSDSFVLWLCLACAAVAVPTVPGFATLANVSNLLATLLPLFVVALGQTIVLIVGGIDLSVTSVIGLTSIVGAMAINDQSGWLARSPLAAPAGVALMLGLGATVGAVNGLAVTRGRMPAFIVTLASMMAVSGLAVWLTHSQAINALPAAFTVLGGNTVVAGTIAVALAGFLHLLLTRSLFGRWLYAVGHNARAAHLSGVPVAGVTAAAYVAAGFLAACASVLYTGQAETGSPVLGQRLLLDVIGATVIGGTSLFGGRGRVLWTLYGVVFLKLIDNTLNLLNLSLFAITMTKGAVILLAACLDALRTRLTAGRGS